VVLIFGTKKLRNLGQDLGGAVKGFKEGMKMEDDKGASTEKLESSGASPAREGTVKEESKA